MNTQQKFMKQMEKIAADAGLDLVVDTAWANTGRISFERPDRFAPELSFSYNFQAGYASCDSIVGGKRWPYITYAPDGRRDDLDSFVATIRFIVMEAAEKIEEEAR